MGVVLTRSIRKNREEYKTTIFALAFYGAVVERYFSKFRRLLITVGVDRRSLSR